MFEVSDGIYRGREGKDVRLENMIKAGNVLPSYVGREVVRWWVV